MLPENQTNPSLAERLQKVQAGLRPDLEVSRHTFRGEASYIVCNPITFQSHHFSKANYQILIELDSEVTLGDTFEALVAKKKLKKSQEEEFYSFILSLNQSGFLNLPITDGKALYERFKKRQSSEKRSKLTGFLFWRVPLINPDAMLNRTMRHAAPFFSRFAFMIWLVLIVICIGIIWRRWDDFREPLQSILVTKNIVSLWILLVGLKIVHEFGHAYVCKMYGGKVPEMGAFFICFTPCAYVDASASWGFASKKQRIAVSLGGMYVESFVACLAVLIWNATGPSLINSFAHQAIVLASIVTIGFNINPLMRYDGYYILSDLVEIPNLREKSTLQLKNISKRCLFGIHADVLPFSRWNRILLFSYGICAAIWKVTLVAAICIGIAMKIYILGAMMALFYGSTVIWGMGSNFVKFLWKSPETAPVRTRAIALGLFVFIGVPFIIAIIPIWKPVELNGVVAVGDEKPVFAQASGFLKKNRVVSGQAIQKNEVMYTLDNDRTRAIAAMALAEFDLFRLRAECELEKDPASAAMIRKQADHAKKTLRQTEQDIAHLSIRAPLAGKVIDREAIKQIGRFINEGEQIATIISHDWTVQSLATAEDFADIKPQVGQKVRVRLHNGSREEFSGTITNVAAAGSKSIPTASLTQLGGGTIAVHPDTMTAKQPFFEITIKLEDAGDKIIQKGTTTQISFQTPPQTLGVRLYRSVLRFLNKLRT